MKADKLSLLIFTLTLLLVLFPQTLYSFVKKRLDQPKLSIQIKLSNQSHAQQKWISKEMVDSEPLYVYEIFWHFNVIIKNHSQHAAHNPKLSTNFQMPHRSHLSPLNHSVPIMPNEETEITGEYIRLEKCKEGTQTIPDQLPVELNKIKFLLEYQNHYRHNFFTVFDFKHKSNYVGRGRPSDFV